MIHGGLRQDIGLEAGLILLQPQHPWRQRYCLKRPTSRYWLRDMIVGHLNISQRPSNLPQACKRKSKSSTKPSSKKATKTFLSTPPSYPSSATSSPTSPPQG